MITIACVLKSGGDFDISYVKRLSMGIRRTLCTRYEFICLTDVSPENFRGYPIDRINPLEYNWPGWWSKMELFRLPGPLMYLDLDMVLINSLDKLALRIIEQKDLFVMLRGFYRKDHCSGILGWNGDVSAIFDDFYEKYSKTSKFNQKPHATYMISNRRHFRGDQEWLGEYLKNDGKWLKVKMAQDITPGIYSYKVHMAESRMVTPPSDSKIICFHGHPRPHEVSPTPDWLTKHWRLTNRIPLSHDQASAMRRGEQLTNYPDDILGAPEGLDDSQSLSLSHDHQRVISQRIESNGKINEVRNLQSRTSIL